MAFDSRYVRTPSPFAFRPVVLGWFYDLALQGRLKAHFDGMGMQNLAVAMVDLTGASNRKMSYAGYNDERQTFAGSLPKIVIMLAAYRLREQVRMAAKDLGIGDAKKLFPELEKAWTPLITNEAFGRPAAFPKLDKIFEMQIDARKADFSPEFQWQLDRAIEGIGSNEGAAYCAKQLGFAYINGVLQWEGLQEGKMGQKGFKGLSLALDYGGTAWGQDGGAVAQGATAKAVVAFMTALYNRQLVSKEASEAMLARMKLATSWFEMGLTAARRRPLQIYKKVGLYGGWSEGAIIETRPDILFFRYAAAVIAAPTIGHLGDAIVGIDRLMEGRY
jgi:hypothetical protein